MSAGSVLGMLPGELIVDNFAGGGGASTGIAIAVGRAPDLAINHDRRALALYQANHPGTRVLCEDVFDVCPLQATRGRPVGLAWFSPDCTFFSKARGGKPHRDRHRARRRRGLAGIVLKWAAQVHPRVICVENVEEFQQWGPLGDDGLPDRSRRGESFRRWMARLINLGYKVETRELRACDYGAPTSRRRLFVIARRDGKPIVWPEPTHGPGRAHPYRTAADCIDWSIPCPSIFDRKRPLARATLERIARGIRRFIMEPETPFIVPGKMVAPTLIQVGYGERPGQAPRAPGLGKPLGTVVAASKHALVEALLSPYMPDGARGEVGIDPAMPADLAASHIVKLKGTCRHGQPVTTPLGTVQAQGTHYGEVRTFLIAYYGTAQAPQLGRPMPTVTTRDRFALVTVRGQAYAIADIGMRMLQPHEMFAAQDFPASYKLDVCVEGKPLTKTDLTRMCGNAVPPAFSRAIVQAQLGSR